MNLISEKFFFIKIPLFFTVLMPIFLVTGSFLPDFAISICSILFLINSYRNKLFLYYKNIFFIFYFSFYIYLNLSALLSSNIIFSLKTSLPYIRFGIFALSTWYLIDNEKKLLKYFFYSFLFIFLFLIIDGFYQAYNKYNLFNYPLISNRVSSLFGDELILGSFLSRNFPFFIGLFLFLLNPIKISKKIVYSTYVVIFCVPILVFISGERTSFFFLIIVLFFMILFLPKNIKIFITISFFFIAILTYTNYSKFSDRIFLHTKDQLTHGSEQGKRLNVFSRTHEEHFLSAIKIFKDNVFFGAGPKSFRLKCAEEKYLISNQSCITHPHNTYIQLLSETGIIGFSYVIIIFFILLYYLLKVIYQTYFLNYKINFFKVFLLISFLITLWPLSPSGNFFTNWLNAVYFLPVGFFLWVLKNKNVY